MTNYIDFNESEFELTQEEINLLEYDRLDDMIQTAKEIEKVSTSPLQGIYKTAKELYNKITKIALSDNLELRIKPGKADYMPFKAKIGIKEIEFRIRF